MTPFIKNILKSNKKYQHLFFDLDHTLWDFEKNSVETLHELFVNHHLGKQIESSETFITTYQKINKFMWENHYNISVDQQAFRVSRFEITLKEFGINDLKLAKKISEEYLLVCPQKGKLFEYAHQVLNYLSHKYTLHIITNGFKEVQHLKIKSAKLESYFKNIIISEDVGFIKPEKEIFNYAVKLAQTKTKVCLMIGDNPKADINGAANAGIDTVFFNPEKVKADVKCTYEISELKELLTIL